MLVIDCLSRGEIIAPRIFIDQLMEHHGLTREVLCMYIVTAVQQGKPFLQVVQELGEAVDFTSFPEVAQVSIHGVMVLPAIFPAQGLQHDSYKACVHPPTPSSGCQEWQFPPQDRRPCPPPTGGTVGGEFVGIVQADV